MTIKEIETKLKELAENEKSIKAEIDNMQIALSEAISKEKAKTWIPDDVRDIPLMFNDDEVPTSDYDTSDGGIETCYQYYMIYEDGSGADDEFDNKEDWIEDYARNKRRIFLDWNYAKDFRDKTQLLADCKYFKFRYDHDYEPNWNDYDEDKWYITYDTVRQEYCYGGSGDGGDCGITYFSTEDIVAKCADWLNFIYKKGKYTND